MCGICGIVQLGGEPRPVASDETLRRMTDAMTHRGPDDSGAYAADSVALGARRLSIVDLEGGHQPVASEDGSVLAVQNGELYNHASLRESLVAEGHRFRTRCDTEILPHLYERYAERYPAHLRGMFATAVWDGRERRAVIARDRLGVKPLYWTVCGDVLVFASELKSLLASGLVDTALDYEAIDAYLLLGFFPAPSTPLAGVYKLLPGHVLIADARGVRTEPYWRYPSPAVAVAPLPEAEYKRQLLDEVETAVRLRLMSDVPLGAMLSGGLDSSLVVALMARNMSEPVKTFSVGFAESGTANELVDASTVARAFGTDHHSLELSYREAEIDIDELVWSLDEPLADLSSLGFLALSELAAKHVTVALSGQGADELLGGYPSHRNAQRLAWWYRSPPALRSLAGGLTAHGNARLRRIGAVLGARDASMRFYAQQRSMDDRFRHDLYTGPLAETNATSAQRAIGRALADEPPSALESALRVDALLGLPDDMLHYFDRTSMAHSLEVRVPFLDHHLVEFCATVPSRLKIRGGTTKYLLKEAARGLVPDAIVDKPKVGFFNRAVRDWFGAQVDRALVEQLVSGEARTRDFLSRPAVARLSEAVVHRSATQRHARLLLSILMLEVWLSVFLPRALRTSGPREPVAAG